MRDCVSRHSVAGAATLALALAFPCAPASGETIADQARDHSKDVFVTNDGAHAVPVRQQGTADVNVVNLPALAPVQKTAFGSFPSGNRFSNAISLFTVPAGKVLVIQSVSIASNLSSADETLLHVLFSAQFGDFIPVTINVQPVAEGVFSQTGANVFRKTEAVTAYAEAGTTVSATGTRDGTNVNFLDSLGVSISGYLVDAPH